MDVVEFSVVHYGSKAKAEDVGCYEPYRGGLHGRADSSVAAGTLSHDSAGYRQGQAGGQEDRPALSDYQRVYAALVGEYVHYCVDTQRTAPVSPGYTREELAPKGTKGIKGTSMQTTPLFINWQETGRPDKGRVGEVIESLPAEIRSRLSRPTTEILKEIIFLCWLMAKHSGRGNAYCFPGREYLAGKANRSVSTVKRSVGLVEDLNLITRQQRRPVRGHWSTNLYTLGTGLLAVMYARLRKLGAVFTNRGSFSNRIRPKEGMYKRNRHLTHLEKTEEPHPPYHQLFQPPVWEEEKWTGAPLSELFRQAREGSDT